MTNLRIENAIGMAELSLRIHETSYDLDRFESVAERSASWAHVRSSTYTAARTAWIEALQAQDVATKAVWRSVARLVANSADRMAEIGTWAGLAEFSALRQDLAHAARLVADV